MRVFQWLKESVPRQLQPAISFFKELWQEFIKDNSSLMAAAVSFYIFLSLAPLLLLAAAALSYALGSEEQAYTTVIDYLHGYSPQLARQTADTIREVLTGFIEGRGAATGFGVVALVWSGSQAFVILSKVMNIAWGSQPRSFIWARVLAIGLMFAVGILLLISFGISTAANAVLTYDITLFGHDITALFGQAWRVAAYLLPLIVTIATFTLLYKVMPTAKVPLSSALTAAIVAGLLWESAKQLFSWYVANIVNFNAVYGPLAGIVLLLVWIYYSAVVIILGAQISAIHYSRFKKEDSAAGEQAGKSKD
jgi:membrane protein